MNAPLIDAQLRKAARLKNAGRFAEAIAAYERLLAEWPALPDSWFNLAVLRRKVGQFEAALAAYGEALDRGVAQPEEAHLNRGVIYADHLRQDAAAERELAAALALNPRYLPALLNLANLQEDFGRRDAALETYERLLALDPQHSEALARYAVLKEVASAGDPLVERLRSAIARSGARTADQASLGFALGKLLDGCGAYDEAFDAYTAANRASCASVAAPGSRYDRPRAQAEIDALIAAYAPRGARAKRNGSPDLSPAGAPRPIFICGMFRSGSTLVEQVLACHPRVIAGGELDVLPALVRGELAPYPASMRQITPQRLQVLARKYLGTLAQRFPGAAVVTDKRPDNFLHIGLIKALFPDAKIVHTTRDPLDNCLSIYFLHLDQRMSYALDLMDTGHHYAQYRRLMAHWKSLYAEDILDFDYDAFVREPRPAIERLLAFCELEWDDACLTPERAAGAVKTASVWQVRQPIYQASSGRAANYARQLAPLAAWLRQEGS